MRVAIGFFVVLMPIIIFIVGMAIYTDDWVGVLKAVLATAILVATIGAFVMCGMMIIKGGVI